MHRSVAFLRMAAWSMLVEFGVAVDLQYPEMNYSLGVWPEDGGFGNHRVIVNHVNSKSTGTVVAVIPWRRRDLLPEKQLICVFDSRDGKEIKNVVIIKSTNELGVT